MKKFPHLWRYLVEFFLEWEMFYTNIVEKIKTHILRSITFFWKSRRIWECRKVRWSKRGQKLRHNMAIRVACWVTKPTCTHAYAYASAPGQTHACAQANIQICNSSFPRQQCVANAPHCYFIRTLPVLLSLNFNNDVKNIVERKKDICSH
jgi:hypothetical protein